MHAYINGQANGKRTKCGIKYYEQFIDDFWKPPGK